MSPEAFFFSALLSTSPTQIYFFLIIHQRVRPYQNAVGYNQTGLREDGKLAGFGFTVVSESTMDLSKVTVSGYDPEDGSSGDVEIQFLDSLGRTESTYSWQDYTKKGTKYYGWENDDGDIIDEGDVVLAPGTGVWVVAPDDTYVINCSGQVLGSSVSVTLREDGKLVANPHPTGVDLSTVWVSGYDPEDGSSGDVEVQVLDSLGRTESTYSWQDYTKKGTTYYGWENDDGDIIEMGDMVLGAGEALWAVAPDSSFSINFPALSL